MEIVCLGRVLRQTGLGLFSSAGVRGHILLSLWTDAESASFPSGSHPHWVKSIFILVQLICRRSVLCMLEIWSFFFFFEREQENRISTFGIQCKRPFQLFLCVWWASDYLACPSTVKLWFCLSAICYCRPTHWLSSKPVLFFFPLPPTPQSADIDDKCLFFPVWIWALLSIVCVKDREHGAISLE